MPTSTLRDCEHLGRIRPVCRNGLRWQFNEETVVQLALIGLGKAAGFSLEEIGGLLGKNQRPDLAQSILLQRADELDRKVLRMSTMSRLLRHVAECPAPSHMECPRFRKLLRVVCPSVALKDALSRGSE
ncbi:TPA: MerR family DNA-binding protein [Serratia fonticola]|uniref:MerR family DNA-binding protein n=1 Tax=Serratia fonticola TaxID=47917 RepID=UPI0021B842AC|nr:MerR family DNA-binding protein [Serratia fonticola]